MPSARPSDQRGREGIASVYAGGRGWIGRRARNAWAVTRQIALLLLMELSVRSTRLSLTIRRSCCFPAPPPTGYSTGAFISFPFLPRLQIWRGSLEAPGCHERSPKARSPCTESPNFAPDFSAKRGRAPASSTVALVEARVPPGHAGSDPRFRSDTRLCRGHFAVYLSWWLWRSHTQASLLRKTNAAITGLGSLLPCLPLPRHSLPFLFINRLHKPARGGGSVGK